jgi:2-polyprenyl-3-methyl-5-hydroxy-6-metoxy-1,4-benzoquinol methylase
MRRQLRPFYTEEQLMQIYDHPYDHTRWMDHVFRIERTLKFAAELIHGCKINGGSVIDLSCGDGAIVRELYRMGLVGAAGMQLGDRVPAEHLTVVGPIEQTIKSFQPQSIIRCCGKPGVNRYHDLFICTETLEHVEDPDALLREIRLTANYAIFTTPAGEFDDRNEEHYWGWDADGLREMLTEAGFTVVSHEIVPTSYYTYQFWGVKS